MLRNFFSNTVAKCFGFLAICLISASVNADIYDAGGVEPSYTSATDISDTANQWHNRVSTTDAYNVTDPNLTVSISSSTSVSPYSLTFSSSAATSSFVASDVYVTGGTLSSFSGSGSSFSATVTESSSGAAVSIIVPASGFQDNAGNNNTQASLFGNYPDTLNAGADVSKTLGDASYTQAASGGSGNGEVTYTSSATSVATVSSAGVVTIVGAGSATITATRAADANYNAVSDSYVLIVNAPPGFSLSKTTASVNEDLSTDTFTVVLTAEPASNVVIDVVSGDTGEATVAPAALTFTTANWNSAQTVTVTGVNDDLIDGNQTATITVSVNAASSDDDFDSLADQQVTATVADNDTAGFSLSKTTASVNEDLSTDTFTVVLTAEPASNVVIDVVSGDTGEATVAPAALTFTTANWNSAQTVTVTGVNDDLIDGNQTATITVSVNAASSDDDFDSLADQQVTATVADNDTAGFSLSKTTASVNEDLSTDTFTVVLTAEPASNVVIDVVSGDTGEATVAPAALTFTTANWNSAQTVTVTGVNDDLIDGNQTATITVSVNAASSDDDFDSLADQQVTATVADNDTAGFSLSKTTASVNEDLSTDTFTVVLTAEPASNVVIDVVSGDTGEATVAPAALTFTTANWNSAQTVTVTGVNDDLIDGNQTATITVSVNAASSDDDFDSLADQQVTATVADNDTAGFSLSKTTASVNEDLSTDTFTVVLTAEPASNVVIDVVSGDTGEATVAPAALTFTTANWNSAQTVTVTGVNDDLIDGSQTAIITVSVNAASSDDDFDSLADQQVTATVADNDTAGFSLSKTTASVNEDLSTDTFTVVLTAEPASNVVIDVVSGDTGEATVAPAALTFTTANWNSAQTVTVTGVNDDLIDGNQTATITVSVNAASSDDDFDSLADQQVTATVADNDTAGFSLSKTTASVNEDLSTDTFTVVLTAEPASNVVIDVVSGDTGEATVAPAALTFTTANWNSAQTVTVTGVNDDLIDGNQTATITVSVNAASSDDDFDSLADQQVTATVADNDTAGFSLSKTTASVNEDLSTDTFTVVLTAEPASNVVIDVVSGDTGEATVAPAALTFTTANWNSAQTVTVTGVNDDLIDGNQTATITVSVNAASSDDDFDSLADQQVTATVADNDTAGFSLSKTTASVNEDLSTDTFTVVLTAEPASNVVIDVVSGDTGEATVAPAALTFTTANWNSAQTVTVTGVNDDLIDGNQTATITVSVNAASSDDDFDSLADQQVTATVADNDTAGFSLSKTTASVNEDLSTDTFTVVLTAEPASNVVIDVVSGDTGEATVAPAALTFTTANWNSAQTVTVTGVNDDLIDGNQTATITVSVNAASSDDDFDSLADQQVTATVADNDTAGFSLSKTTASVNEDLSTDTFTVVLTAEPASNVVIDVVSGDTGEATVAPAALTFTTANWNSAQTVTVTGVNDDLIDGNQTATITVSVNAASSDDDFDSLADQQVTATVADNDTAGFSLSKTTASVNEDLSTDTFTVVLTAEPASNVVIDVVSGDTGEATVAPAALTFTTANWNSAQTVTVTGVNDDLIDGNQTATITVSVNAASSDDDFDSLADQQVTATVADDITAPVITVTGANPATVEQGATYSDAGATADGGETVTSSGTVDTLTAGTYIITYSASDATGNEGTATRSVNVVDTTAPTLDVSGLSATVESGTTALGSVSANESVTWSVAGNAAFAASATIGSETDSTYSVALGDVNGDGHLDVVVGNYNQTNKLYLGDGSGGFGASTTIGSETDSTYSVALGDVNGDGHLDVVVGNYNQTNKLYLGDGSGGFGASTTIGSETGGTLSVALGDVNGDGYLDVVAANSGANKLYLGDGSGGFVASTTIGSETDSTSSITLGDVNGDGHLDVVVGNYSQTNKLYLGDGSGGFGASTTIGSETGGTLSVALGDVNGDGYLDVVAANSGANKLYLGDGSGGFGASTTIGSETDFTYSVALGDVNGDGHLDVVVGNYSQTNKLYLGDGSGGFGASTTIGSETDYTSSITLGDVNGDGHLDVVAGNEDQTNKLYLNESIGVVINSSGVVALTSSAVLSAGSYSFDIKAVDAAGNATIVSHTTTVAVDSTAPAITSATTGTNLAENSGAGQTVYTITATDAVGVTGYAIDGADASLLTLAGAVVILDANPDYETKNSYSFTVTASDAAGNTSGATTVTFAITDVDDVAPVITVTGSNPATVVQGATYIDAGATADGGETVTSSGTVDTSTVAPYTITYSATDAAGNTGTATRTVNVIIVVDTTAPVITIIAGTDTVERGSSWTDVGATADGGETVTSSGTVDTSTVAAYTVTYSATDAAGNTGTATRTVNVIDTTAPVITVIAGTDTVERGSAWTDVGATADGGETVTSSGTVDTSTVAAYTVTYSATDAAGNTGTATRTVNVIDTTAPVITVIAGTDTVERGSAWTDAGATADGGETVTSSGTVDTSTVAAYTITYSATDAAGNTGTATRTVNVIDTTAPVITVIAGTDTVERGSAWTDAGATADGGETVTSSGTVDTSTVAAYTVTYSATDAAGNTGTATRTVTVADTVAPVITLLGDAELTLEVGDTFTDAGATATDTVDGNLSDDIVVTGSVDTTSVGSYTLTYNVSDAAGNEATPVTRIVIVADMVAPVITLLGDAELTLEVGDTFTDAGATATDTVDGNLSDDIVVTGSVDTTSVGTYTLTYNVSDAAGNAATPVTRIVIVADTVAPVITLLGDAELTLEVGDTFTDAGATATDTVDGNLSDDIVVTGSVDTTSVGTYTLTYNVSDAAGNAATPVTRIVIVADMVAPVITLLGDAELTLEVGDTFTDAGATATDTVDGNLSDDIVVTGSVDTTSVGTYTLTYNVSDAAGNAATPVTRIVIVADTVAPVITLLGDAELTLEVGDTFTDAGATATDTVDGNLSDDIVVTGSVDTTSVGTYTLTYNVSDAAGNAATPVTRIVIVADMVAPVITLLGDAELTLEVGDTFTDAGATATDTVDGNLSDDIVVTGSVDTTSVGTYTLTYNVSDAAGNAATPVTRIVIVADTVAPVITLLGDAELTLEVGDTFTDAGATATDTVDGNLSDDIVVTGSVDTTSVGTYTLTYNVSDAAGNAATPVTRIVIVADTVAPVITLLGDAELTLEVGDTFTDAGATATDTVDGNLSDDIVVTGSVDTTSVGTYTLTYNVSDAAGNAATPVTRIVIVADMVAPVITLLGDAELTLEVGDTFTDAGATATDTVDGNLSDDIVVTGSVDTTSVGTYTLTYNVSDAAGNAATAVTRTVVVNEISITIIVPNDITVNAVGYLTAVDLDPQDISFAVDGDGNTLAITPDQFGLFQSGTYEIIWSATNGTSTVTETQILKVVPLVNLGTPITTTEGNNLTIDVILSGTAADYPVSVPFTISGTAVEGEDYTVDPSGMVTISDGTQGVISLSIITDDIAESEESVVITIGEPLNASLGVLHEQIVTIAEENLAPKAALMVSQGDVIGTTVTKDQGLVTATADIDDANADDVHTINWASALNDIPNASVDPETQALIFDPADLDVGVTELAAEVSDGTNIVSVYVVVNIIDQAPVLSDQADSDGDGLTDADEGAGDIDGDNIPDYQDSISHPNVIAADFEVLQSEPGTIIMLGARALAAGRNVVSLLNKGAIGAPLLEADPAYEFANNLIDFELNGAEFGHSYRLVVPLEFELNEGAVYRKYVNDIIGWQDFIYDANNDILSTFAVDGACPAPGSDVYTPGLKAGHNCIELVIEEGGPNDADGIVNGNLVDPGGVADKYIGTPSELSEVRLRTYKMLANGVDTTVITVNAYDADGVWLDHMSVSASSLLPGAQISEFTAQGNGVYTAILTAGNVVSNGPVTVVIDNGEVSVSLRSDRLRLEMPGIDKPLSSGGCTVATNGSTDASLLLLLIMSGLLLVRRRYRHNI